MTETRTEAAPNNISHLLQQGQQLFAAGKLLEAAKCFQAILKEDSSHLESLLTLSLIARQSSQFTLSLQLAHQVVQKYPSDSRALLNLAHAFRSAGDLKQAAVVCEENLRQHPDDVLTHCVLGELLYSLGEVENARAQYRQAIQKEPNFAHAYSCFGNLECQEKNVREGAKLYHKAVEIAPEWAEAHFALGYALHELRDKEGAIHSLRRALELKPMFPAALLNLGNVFYDYKEYDQAAIIYRMLTRMDPMHANGYCNLANTLAQQGKAGEAIAYYQAALMLDPNSSYTTHKLANLLSHERDWVAAEACYRKVLEQNPQNPEAHNDYGNIFFHQRKLKEAVACYRKALELNPDLAIAHSNIGNALQDLGDYPGAIVHYKRSVELDPTSAGAHYNLALSQLCEGDYPEGFRGYEWRWDFTTLMTPRRPFPQPLWLGQPLKGKRILLHAEQGLGDTIQFVRYIPMVAARGAEIILEVAPALKALFQDYPGVKQVVARGEQLPFFDYQCPLMSLALAFKTTVETIPAKTPYISIPATEAEQASHECPGEGLRIGISWAGNPKNKRDDLRSIPLKEFVPLTSVPGLSFFALQKGPAMAQVPELSPILPLDTHCSTFGSFRETAALIETLDLVITVDTAVAHLAGAMNKPVWLLLPFVGDWRWMRNRDDNPWYPTARLFRQSEERTWSEVIANVTAALSDWARTARTKKAQQNTSVLGPLHLADTAQTLTVAAR